jgi:hypothetical protein
MLRARVRMRHTLFSTGSRLALDLLERNFTQNLTTQLRQLADREECLPLAVVIGMCGYCSLLATLDDR